MKNQTELIRPGTFQSEDHWYPKALNATIHPMVSFFSTCPKNGSLPAIVTCIPAPDSWLCNVAQGGTSVAAKVSLEEEQIIARINPTLAEAGVLIYGADTLTDDDGRRVLSEINTLSIGGFPQAELQSGRSII